MNNEEKIMEMLAQLTDTVSKQGAMLAQHGKLLAQISEEQQEMRVEIAEMQTTLTMVAVTQEGVVLPRLQLLFEGHDEIKKNLGALAEKSRVEALEDDVAMLKDSVKLMRIEINELKKVQ